jgi:hypothetical protein
MVKTSHSNTFLKIIPRWPAEYFRIALFVLVCYGFMPSVSASTGGVHFAGGSGSPADPFLIANVDHLQAIRNASKLSSLSFDK